MNKLINKFIVKTHNIITLLIFIEKEFQNFKF